MRDEARALVIDLVRDRMRTEETDWLDFPDDFENDDHPVHRYREALAYLEGGRYPTGFSHTFDNVEFEMFMKSRCSWQTATYPSNTYCEEPVADTRSARFLSCSYCPEHCEEALTDY